MNKHLAVFGIVIGSVSTTLDVLIGSVGWALLSAASVLLFVWVALKAPKGAK